MNGSVSGDIVDDGTLAFANPNTQSYAGVISGSGGLTKSGVGLLTLNGGSPNRYTGDTFVNSGTLVLAKGGQGPANNYGSAMGGALVILSGGTVRYGADSQVRDDRNILNFGTLDLNGFAESITSLSVLGGSVTTGSGYINVRGSVTANNFSTSSYAGNLHLEVATAGVASTVLVLADGTFNVSAVVANGDNGLATQLEKTEGGTLNLTNANTYSGGTTVIGGRLMANNSSGSATGPGFVTVNNSGTLGGSGTIAGSVTVNSGGSLAPGNSPGRLTLSTNLTLSSGSTYKLELGGFTAGSQYDQVLLTKVDAQLTLAGDLQVSLVNGFTLTAADIGRTFNILVNNAALAPATSGAFANAPGGFYTDAAGDLFQVNYAANTDNNGLGIGNDVTLTLLGVPEPSSATLIMLGGLGISLARRRSFRRGLV